MGIIMSRVFEMDKAIWWVAVDHEMTKTLPAKNLWPLQMP